MRNPMVGRVTSEFSPSRRHPVTGVVTQHWGIDLGAPTGISPQAYVGADIRAAYGGVVERAGWGVVPHRSGNGVLIRNPDGERQYYGHLSRVDVRVGQQVSEGQVIGGMGATGNVTGPHLHFECHNTGSTAANGFSRVRDPRQDFRAAGITPGRDNPPPTAGTPGQSPGGSTMSWSNRDVDFVNSNNTTARHQLGRIHENTQPSEQGRTSWRWWGLDYVNNNPISKDSQLARAHQHSRNASRLNDRRIDYVNDEGSETTARHQIARAHQYSMDARREAREANEKLDAMAEALGETLAAVVDESVRDAFAAKMSQIKDEVAQVNASDVAAELEVSAKETEAEEQEEEETE